MNLGLFGTDPFYFSVWSFSNSASRLHLNLFDEPLRLRPAAVATSNGQADNEFAAWGPESLKHGNLWLFNGRTVCWAGTLITCSTKLPTLDVTTFIHAHHPVNWKRCHTAQMPTPINFWNKTYKRLHRQEQREQTGYGCARLNKTLRHK